MNVLDIWDWKYRIFFHDDIKQKVENFAGNLSREEQQIYKKMLEFASETGFLFGEYRRNWAV